MNRETFERRCEEMRLKYAALSLREVQLARDSRKKDRVNPNRKRSPWSERRFPPLPRPPTARIADLSSTTVRKIFSDRSTEKLRSEESELFRELEQCLDLVPLYRSALRRIRIELKARENEESHPRRRSASQIKYPDSCPRCGHTVVIRAGFVSQTIRHQMFRCKSCNSTFVDPEVRKSRVDFNLVCHRCGGSDTENRGPGHKPTIGRSGGGRQGFCFSCDKGFLQGGHDHLTKNYSELVERVRQLGLPRDVTEEIVQDAALRVTAGEGYVATIELRKAIAFREVRGEYNQKGSDHPVIRLHQGQPPLED